MTNLELWNTVAIATTSLLAALLIYVWTAIALGAVFRKSGEPAWKGWVPILNLVVLLRLGGLSGWLVLLFIVPIVGWIALLFAVHRINVSFGYGGGMTVLAFFLFPVWASIVGFGPERWVGREVAEHSRTRPLDVMPVAPAPQSPSEAPSAYAGDRSAPRVWPPHRGIVRTSGAIGGVDSASAATAGDHRGSEIPVRTVGARRRHPSPAPGPKSRSSVPHHRGRPATACSRPHHRATPRPPRARFRFCIRPAPSARLGASAPDPRSPGHALHPPLRARPSSPSTTTSMPMRSGASMSAPAPPRAR